MTQPLGIQISGVTSSGRKVYRVKTYGPGTLAGHDFLNSSTYLSSITPLTSIPDGTKLSNLTEVPGGLVSPAAMVGASVLSAGGGIVTGTGKSITLPSSFKLPSAGATGTITTTSGSNSVTIATTTGGLFEVGQYVTSANIPAGAKIQSITSGTAVLVNDAGAAVNATATASGTAATAAGDLKRLIIIGLKPVVTTPTSTESIAGWATNTSAANNWCLYRNSGNAVYFFSISNVIAANSLITTNTPHRFAAEIIKSGKAGTLTVNMYLDGSYTGQTYTVPFVFFPQPTSANALLGTAGFSQSANANEFNSAEIRDLSLETATTVSIVAADYAAWGSRFS